MSTLLCDVMELERAHGGEWPEIWDRDAMATHFIVEIRGNQPSCSTCELSGTGPPSSALLERIIGEKCSLSQ